LLKVALTATGELTLEPLAGEVMETDGVVGGGGDPVETEKLTL
jgi:hypothetical protein